MQVKSFKILLILPFLFAFIIVGSNLAMENLPTVSVAASNNKKVVVIDAGHGGIDPGATMMQFNEKNINLDVAKKVKEKLEDLGVAVVLTRDSDVSLAENTVAKSKNAHTASLQNRVSMANQKKAVALVSIHVNSSDDPNHYGPQTYYRQGAAKGMELAENIQVELLQIRSSHRAAIVGDYYLLNNSEVPAVIVEIGFLTNDQDRELLLQDEYCHKMAEAIAQGVIKFIQ